MDNVPEITLLSCASLCFIDCFIDRIALCTLTLLSKS